MSTPEEMSSNEDRLDNRPKTAMTHVDELGVLATESGRVVDIVTRIDLVQYWNRGKK